MNADKSTTDPDLVDLISRSVISVRHNDDGEGITLELSGNRYLTVLGVFEIEIRDAETTAPGHD